MRLLNLDGFDSIELWRGRRLYCTSSAGPQIISLPRGAMTTSRSKTTQFISFGSPTRTSCQVSGSARKGLVEVLAAGIVELERPAARVKIL